MEHQYEPPETHLIRKDDPQGPTLEFDDWGEYGTGVNLTDGSGHMISLRPDDVDELYKILTEKKEQLGHKRRKEFGL